MKSIRLLLFVLLLSLATLACGLLASEPEATATPVEVVAVASATPEPLPTATTEPTSTLPPPTEIPPSATPEPTEAPPAETVPTETTPAQEAVAAFELASSAYAHPAFSLVPPAGWEAEEGDWSVTFQEPGGEGFINAIVVNTGVELDGDGFTRFVQAREQNFFGRFADYQPLSEDINIETQVAAAEKSVSFEEIPESILSVYDQYGPIIYIYDFWAEEGLYDSYLDGYLEIIDTLQVNTTAAADYPVYGETFTFTGPGDLFSIEVPTPWRYEVVEDESTLVDTFYSPDEHAVIQNIAYDDGTEISRSAAGALALQLLRTYYASDITITDDQVQADGSERLIWQSPSGDYSGISFLETRGTTFLLLTVMYDNPYEDTYLDILSYTIESYAIP